MSGDRIALFDRLARRCVGDGIGDAEALACVAKLWPPIGGPMPDDALARIAAIRATLPPERTDAEAWAMLDDALARFSERGHAEAVGRGGPPPGDGLGIEAIRAALRDWTGPWPPPEEQIVDQSARRVRQVLREAGTSWRTEVEAAERR